MFAYNANHAQIFSWNQLILCNEVKASCSNKQWEPLMGTNLQLTEYVSNPVPLCPQPPSFLNLKLRIKKYQAHTMVGHQRGWGGYRTMTHTIKIAESVDNDLVLYMRLL